MTRLYLRIYVALLASLAIFAVLAALGWKLAADRERPGQDERALFAEVLAEILPAADAPAAEQQAALERWHRRAGADLALFDAQRRPIAAVGRPIPPPASDAGGREGRGGWAWRRDGTPVWSVQLPDGRWAAARAWPSRTGPPVAWGALLVALALAVAIGAFPLARRLTRRLERLQGGVEALGAGDLSARVRVEGRDEIARLAASFNRSAERIETLVSSHRSLLANASHELRSPLARLRMAAALLGDADGEVSADPAQRAAWRAEVERNVAELDALVDEILLASRLDAGVGIASEPVDLAALLAEAGAPVGATLRVLGAGAGRGTTVRGDPRLLRRLVRNLLENARRHAAAGPIELELHDRADGPAFEVLDRGPGVPPEERERIFEPFHRLAGHGESAGGVGLGLALVRQIAHRHGATVACLPREGGGSRFRVGFGPTPA